jgi:hypothetical protein
VLLLLLLLLIGGCLIGSFHEIGFDKPFWPIFIVFLEHGKYFQLSSGASLGY